MKLLTSEGYLHTSQCRTSLACNKDQLGSPSVTQGLVFCIYYWYILLKLLCDTASTGGKTILSDYKTRMGLYSEKIRSFHFTDTPVKVVFFLHTPSK